MKKKLHAGTETGFGAGVLIFCLSTGRYLWIRRSETGDFPGYWCAPGGGVEDYETIEQGVKREVKEEIGYDASMELLHMNRTNKDGFVFCNHLTMVEDEFIPVLNAEHTEYLWSTEQPTPIHPGLAEAIRVWSDRYAKADS